MSTPTYVLQLPSPRSLSNPPTARCSPHRPCWRNPRLARTLATSLTSLLLLLPWASPGLAQDVPTGPVHLASASADSAEMTVDLSDPTKFPFSSTGKWKGYLEFLGKPGTERSLGQPDLFLPILQDLNDMTFLNIRGQLQFDNTDVSEYNIGLGHRHMFTNWIIGGYGYFDHRNTQLNNSYRQFTGGLELMSVDWAFRMNGYLPENKTETSTTNRTNISVIRPGDQINVQVDGLVQEKALPGLDGEVGYLLPIPWKAYRAVFDETRVYAGGYHFLGEDGFESVTGPRGRVEWRAYDLPVLGTGSRFMMGVEAQWDEPRGSQAFGLVSLRIPFDVLADKSKRNALKGLDRRMLQPVIRDVDVVTSTRDHTETLPALNRAGHAYTKAVDIHVEGKTDAQVKDEIENLKEEFPEDVIAVFTYGNPHDLENMGDEENEDWRDSVATGELSLGANHTLSSAGKALVLDYVSPMLGAGSLGYTPDGTPVGIAGSITMGPGSQVNATTVDATGFDDGIRMDQTGTYYLTNNTIRYAGQSGLTIDNGAEVWADHIIVEENKNGIAISGNAKAEITNSVIGYNSNHGIAIGGDNTTFIAKNIHVEGNQARGLALFDGSSESTRKIDVKDSFFSKNGTGAISLFTDESIFTAKFDNIEVTENGTTGETQSSIFAEVGPSGGEFGPSILTLTNSRIHNNNSEDGVYILGKYMEFVGDNLDIYDHSKVGLRFQGAGVSKISNSRIHENKNGINAHETNLVIDNVETYLNGANGMILQMAAGSYKVTMINSRSYQNTLSGIKVKYLTVDIYDSEIKNNGEYGILNSINFTATVNLTNTVIEGNTLGDYHEALP